MATPASRGGRRWLWVSLAVYAAVLWFGVTPHEVGSSWRECDTMAMSRNFLLDGFDPLRPRVDWRGDTDGAVESEFPLYQMLVAASLVAFGEVEWPARLWSLLAMVWAGVALHRLLEWRTGPGPALVGTLVFLGSAQAVLLGARVQPDGLSTALLLAGSAAFLDYLVFGRGAALWLAVVANALGVLQKATGLQIVAVQGLLVLCIAPHRLREARLWIGLLLIVGVLAAWLWHGVQLHAETGLTFGVLSAGETKFPGLRQLRSFDVWSSLLSTTMRIGLGPFGCMALGTLVARRRMDRIDLSLLVVVGLALVGAMRYSAYEGTGPHYHVFVAVAGAWCMARVWPRRAPQWLWAVTLLGIGMVGAHWVLQEREKVRSCTHAGVLDVAAVIRASFVADALAIVRSHREGYDAWWRRRTNYEEPVLLYQARRRGWVVPADGFEVAELERLRARGADFVVDQLPGQASAEVQGWLAANAELVLDRSGCTVHRLRPSPAK